jgi:hypothetical protein
MCQDDMKDFPKSLHWREWHEEIQAAESQWKQMVDGI